MKSGDSVSNFRHFLKLSAENLDLLKVAKAFQEKNS